MMEPNLVISRRIYSEFADAYRRLALFRPTSPYQMRSKERYLAFGRVMGKVISSLAGATGDVLRTHPEVDKILSSPFFSVGFSMAVLGWTRSVNRFLM